MKTPRFNRECQFRVAATHVVACVVHFESRASLRDCCAGGRSEAALFWLEVQGGSLNPSLFDPSLFDPSLFDCSSVALHPVASQEVV
jgi:hypothetical protein